MKKLLFVLAILPFIFSCNGQEKIDLSKSSLNEPIEKMINYKDTLLAGVETVEYPFCLLIEVENAENYSFDGIDLKGQKIIFQVNSEKLKTDSISRFGGGHIEMKSIKNDNELKSILTNFDAEDKIYGVRIEMKSAGLKADILKKLELKYGKGTKNPNTDNGLYWNVKKENKFIFFAPDYDRLVVLNNTNLSKTCYWDMFNGLIDFGGCDKDKYFQELVKNSTKPENVKNKPIVKIDKNWNLNNLTVGKSTEDDILKSEMSKNFEKMEELDGRTGETKAISYKDEYHDVYLFLTADKTDAKNQKKNIITGYSISDLKKVDITFENGLKPGMKFEDALKLFDKKLIAKTIINQGDLSFANYIVIKNAPYEVSLVFNEKMQFTEINVK